MKILIIGEDSNLQECKQKFGDEHQYTLSDAHREADKLLEDYELVIDFMIDEAPEQIEIYFNYQGTVLLNTTKITLTELTFHNRHKIKSKIFGFNGLPTLVNRELLEVSCIDSSDEMLLKQLCDGLKTKFTRVDDRVGLVTPRVICMIINEAYYTVQEGTASREDVDMAMKLGTNYPYGPFEWTKRIGLRHVYEVLEAVYEDTKDERYKICPLLKKEYLRSV
ncbi:3-hydroxyacyl-CoA dehydrogenase family protein [Pseudochryseolinea flava]|uniref:3-hydroxyacyl-CoA dehydrogenase n=1 Tax=Pseudochryseolinea flava TaxID=2059302 RepID=A0A364YAE8_9BACT|nr:3-hydroxyacyl-CoA dehydrogenase family protein [Pseudochryseolinea flava]RAW03365.1 3-hydroxyacyl-CoA dehydrogenase [Pseudochryseolinea flava]